LSIRRQGSHFEQGKFIPGTMRRDLKAEDDEEYGCENGSAGSGYRCVGGLHEVDYK
jgi:hypothetical protein